VLAVYIYITITPPLGVFLVPNLKVVVINAKVCVFATINVEMLGVIMVDCIHCEPMLAAPKNESDKKFD